MVENIDFDSESQANMAIQQIFHNPRMLKKFRQSPDVVLDDNLLKDIPESERASLKAKIIQKAVEWDQVLPGLSVEDAKKMLVSSLESTSFTFSLFTWLNVALFAVGIGLFILAAISGLVREEEQFSIIFGAGGVIALLPFFITNPLKRISNAASDRSQIRTVILGYWSQLANLRNLINEQKSPSQSMVTELNTELQNAMTHATALLQKYAESIIKEENQESEKKIKSLEERIEFLEKKSSTT